MSFKFCNNTSPPYINDKFKPAGQLNATTRASLLKLNQPLRRTNHGQNISHIASIIWNNLPNSLKTTDNLNNYKHRVKEHFFHRIRNDENNIYIATFNFFILMHNHFSFLLLLLSLLLHYCYDNYYNYYYFY